MRTQEVQRRPEMQRSVGFHAGSPEVFGSHVKSAASDSQSLHMTSAVQFCTLEAAEGEKSA